MSVSSTPWGRRGGRPHGVELTDCSGRRRVSSTVSGPLPAECDDDVARVDETPVILVHGTGATPEENWSGGYAQALPRAGGRC
jgi:hypothetical protein